MEARESRSMSHYYNNLHNDYNYNDHNHYHNYYHNQYNDKYNDIYNYNHNEKACSFNNNCCWNDKHQTYAVLRCAWLQLDVFVGKSAAFSLY